MEKKYDILRPWLTLDDWQKEYIETEGNCHLRCGRQTGKSTAMSIKVVECIKKEKQACDYLILAFTEKQAYNLFFKTLGYLQARYPKLINQKKGKKPTMHIINLVSGSRILCYAAGTTGYGLAGLTIKKLFVDEAAPMSREVFITISPMLSVTGGSLDMSSTPKGKEGYFYECSLSDDFKKFHITAESCERHDKVFLEEEKKRMSELEYAQEYLGMFLDDIRRVFSEQLIKIACTEKPRRPQNRDYFLGCDCARLGGDESTFEIIDGMQKDKYVQVFSEALKNTLVTDIAKRIEGLEKGWKFNRIGIDDGGVGAGVMDILLEKGSNVKHKIIGLNNAKRALSRKEKTFTKLLKEDMYLWLLSLLEHGKLKLLDNNEIKASLASVQYEYVISPGQKTRFRIFGSYTHHVEGIMRATYLLKNKKLRLWARG